MLHGQALKFMVFKQSNSVTNCYDAYGERVFAFCSFHVIHNMADAMSETSQKFATGLMSSIHKWQKVLRSNV